MKASEGLMAPRAGFVAHDPRAAVGTPRRTHRVFGARGEPIGDYGELRRSSARGSQLAEDAGRGSTDAAEGFRFHGSIGGFARSEASIAPLCDRSSRRFHPSHKWASASASLPCFTRAMI